MRHKSILVLNVILLFLILLSVAKAHKIGRNVREVNRVCLLLNEILTIRPPACCIYIIHIHLSVSCKESVFKATDSLQSQLQYQILLSSFGF